MQSAEDERLLAEDLLQKSKKILAEEALDYVLNDYGGGYDYFIEYLKTNTDKHDLLPHYYVVILDRQDANQFMADLSVFLRDILFYDAGEVVSLDVIKDRLLKVAVLDRADLIDDIRGLFELYDKLKIMAAQNDKDALQSMRNLTKDHPYASKWLL